MIIDQTPTILITDDEPEIREIISESLSTLDAKIVEAESGEKAIELIKQGKISVALIDIAMPGMNGIELLKYIHQNKSSITCLMVTAFGSKDYVKDALLAGAFDFIEKPFDPAMLANRVQNAIEHNERLRINELIIEEFLLSYTPNIQKNQFDQMDADTRKRVLKQALALIKLKQANRSI